MSPDNRQFATLIAERRKAAGLTMEQLAAELGVAKSAVHYWESGRSVPATSQLEPLAQALGTSFEDLFAATGYSRQGLPTFAPYLRARYGALPDEALAEAEQFFEQLTERYGEGGDGESDR